MFRRLGGEVPAVCDTLGQVVHPQGPCTGSMTWTGKLRRNILAIVPATPSTPAILPGSKVDGLCGAEQRYGVNSIFQQGPLAEGGKQGTLGHRRLLFV